MGPKVPKQIKEKNIIRDASGNPVAYIPANAGYGGGKPNLIINRDPYHGAPVPIAPAFGGGYDPNMGGGGQQQQQHHAGNGGGA